MSVCAEEMTLGWGMWRRLFTREVLFERVVGDDRENRPAHVLKEFVIFEEFSIVGFSLELSSEFLIGIIVKDGCVDLTFP
jgi:hypothetical protein